MKKIISSFILWIMGWKTEMNVTPKLQHSVMICAPHTSNRDTLLTILTFWKHELEWKYFIKDSYTKNLFYGWFFKWTGAIGVARGKKNNLVEYAVKLLKENNPMVLVVPAEGTRKKVPRWKKGFYVIAKQANVPVSLGYADYGRNVAGVGKVIDLTDNYENDMDIIQEFYAGITARYPDKYNKKIY